VGFSVVLLFLAGLLLLSFGKLTHVDLGFRESRLLLLTVESDEVRFNEDDLMWAVMGAADQSRTGERSAEHEELLSLSRKVKPVIARARPIGMQLLERVRRERGVQSASLSGWPLFSEGGWRAVARLPGRAPDDVWSIYLLVSDGFFETMGIRLLDGRRFEPRDADPKTPTTVVVNEAFARHYFGGEGAVGRVFDRVLPLATVRQEIVGVVADAKYNNVREPAPPTVYVPLRGFRSLQVRAAGEPPALVNRLRQAIEAVHPSLRVTDVQRQSTLVDNTLLRERLLALLSAFFGIVGLLLAAVGLHGVLSYSVVQRTKEIGIRLALGAQQLTVVRSVVADAGLTTLIGAVAGLGGGFYLARFVQTFLYEVEPLDFWSLALPISCLLVVGALAAVRPARRAARVDPVVALRYE
jgi:putative ABC transport system permease protein